MWQLVQANGENADFNCISPTARTKHSTCRNEDGFIYLYGGKSGNMSLKDLWRFDTENNYWEEIRCTGDLPPSLQEHTMVTWNNKIYIFGGEIGYSSQETPLWQLNLNTWHWYKFGSVNTNSPGISSTQPTGRSGHTAVLFENAIYVYGGYQQLKGSLTELWKFDLCTESWSLISGPCITSLQPPARHYHTAIIHGNQMYVYGGMNNLEAKSDFWKWNLIDKSWTKIKCNRGPGELHGHSAIKAFDSMIVFGGERNGDLLQELWRFNFDTENWDKIQTSGMLPSPRSRHTAISNPFIDLPANNWDQQTDASSSISSNNSNQSETNRLSQYNYDLTESTCGKDKNHSSKSTKKLDDDAQFKNEKNKENKCDCNRKNESTIRKFFRKRMKNKLVRSMSTNSYNISHNENCNLNRALINQNSSISTMKKSNTCYEETIKTNQQTENCLMNSNTIDNIATNLQGQCTNASNNQMQENNRIEKNKSTNNDPLTNGGNDLKDQTTHGEYRKYDIGQLSGLNSPGEETEDSELFNKINQLQKELDSKTMKQTATSDNLNNSNTMVKKPRPKSELIPELANLDEENYCWDELKPSNRSVEEWKNFCWISFPSPQNLPNKLNTIKDNNKPSTYATNHSLVKLRNRVPGDNSRKTRPKTYHPILMNSGNDAFSSYFESNLHGINELESLNDDQFITEEEMIFDGKESPTKSESDRLEIELNEMKILSEKANENKQQSPTKTIQINNTGNSIANTMNTTSNTTTVCSPMSTSSAMDNSISQSLSLSSGYQSFMEDSLIDSSTNNQSTNDNTITDTGALSNQEHSSIINNQSDKIRLRNQLTHLRLVNQRTKRYSCNLPNFGSNYEQQANKFLSQVMNTNDQLNKEDDQQMNSVQTKSSENYNGQAVSKQLPNSTSNVEISLNSGKTNWERKMVKTYSTNGFNGKDTIYINTKNVQRNQNGSTSFLNLSEKVHIGSLDFLIKKRKDKKKKKEYQFCMLVFGGNEKSSNGPFSKQPISVYKLYI